MSEIERIYWDSCAWIAVLNEEPARIAAAQHVIDRAERGEVEIWTSTLSIAEVFKVKCAGVPTGTDPAADAKLDAFLAQSYITHIQLDQDIGQEARRLLRDPLLGLRKPNDAIHLASALWHNLDVFHTYDNKDLIALNGKIMTRNGGLITICVPPDPPTPSEGPIFEWAKTNGEKPDPA